MVLKGEVGLDDPVSKYLPAGVTVPGQDGREITLLHLATHRSGLPTVPDDFDPPGPRGAAEPYTVEDAYAFLSRYALPRDPGAAREYSNFGFGLLGHVLGRAAGTTFQDLVRTRILEPLGMEHTGFGPEGVVTGHRGGDAVRHRSDMEIFEGSGALRSTAPDLLRFMKAYVGPTRTELQRAMRVALDARLAQPGAGPGDSLAIDAPATDLDLARARAGEPPDDDPDAYRFAWGTIRHPGEAPVIGHGGGTVGFQSQITFMPERRIGTVLLANDAGLEDQLATHLLYFSRPGPEGDTVFVDTAVLADYAGTYQGNRRSEYYIRLEEDGHLTYQPDGQFRTRLYAMSDSTFYILRGPWSFRFMRDAEGLVSGLWMEVDEREGGTAVPSRLARKVDDDSPPPAVVAGNAGFGAGWGTVWILLGVGVALAGAVALRPVWSNRRGARSRS